MHFNFLSPLYRYTKNCIYKSIEISLILKFFFALSHNLRILSGWWNMFSPGDHSNCLCGAQFSCIVTPGEKNSLILGIFWVFCWRAYQNTQKKTIFFFCKFHVRTWLRQYGVKGILTISSLYFFQTLPDHRSTCAIMKFSYL